MQSEYEKNQAGEPQPGYSKKIRFFTSFEEMNESDLYEMASSTPVQRLQRVTGMIMAMFKNELSHEMTELTIHFK